MRWIEVRDREKVMPAIGIDDSEMAYRRGYQRGAAKAFLAVERFLDPATREVLRAWIPPGVNCRIARPAGILLRRATRVPHRYELSIDPPF
jgi:hypothetical protein